MSSGSASASVISTSGKAARNVAIASGISVAPAEGNVAIRRWPPRTPRIALSSSSAACRRARIPSVCSTSAAPAAVGRRPRRSRSISVVPVSASSVATAWEIAGWV